MNPQLKTILLKIGRALLWLPRMIYQDHVNVIRNFRSRRRL